MRIIGIDPGLARVGYGILDEIEGRKIMLDCGIIETESTQKEEARLLEILNDLSSIINKWNPNNAAIEKFFFIARVRQLVSFRLGSDNDDTRKAQPTDSRISTNANKTCSDWLWSFR